VGRPVREVLIFEIDGRRYGLPASEVRELVRAVAIRPLPLDSTVIEGVIDLRGTIVPVVDLRAGLHLPPKAVEPSDNLIILEAGAGGRPFAVRVDRATELFAADPAALESVHDILPGSEDAAEVVRLPDGLVPLLDLRKLIAAARSAPMPTTLDRSNGGTES
jgi:purine-binding chemotaxis protein CheW